ncbi:MAG: hypothetical protein AMXMBFR36_14320 [Acidobacteriota bacterium]
MGETEQLEAAPARQALEQLQGVDADAGGLGDDGAQVDGDAGTTGGGDLDSPGRIGRAGIASRRASLSPGGGGRPGDRRLRTSAQWVVTGSECSQIAIRVRAMSA